MPVIIEGETGVGKTALVKMLSKLWNQAILLEWKRKHNQLLDLVNKKLWDISSTDVSENYQVCLDFEIVHLIPSSLRYLSLFCPQACVEMVEALSAVKHAQKENLLLPGQLPDITNEQFYSLLCKFLLQLKSDPVVTLLTLQESQQQEVSLEELFETFEKEDSAEVRGGIDCHADKCWVQLC